jgi:dynein heavy chain
VSTQQSIEEKLEKKKGKKVMGTKGTTTCVIFVDDANMPMTEEYGAQPPIELLRQLIDQGGFYDRPDFYWKDIERFIILCAAAPPGGGRSPLTPRFMRHFHVLCVPDPSEDALRTIFESIIREFLQANFFKDEVKRAGSIAVNATIDMYSQIQKCLLPIPAKFHYTFNLRDVAKVFQGMLMTKTTSVGTSDIFMKLWLHECQRVFADRLINEEDREFFKDIVFDLMKSKFKVSGDKKKEDYFGGKSSIIFTMLLRLDAEDKLYEEITDKKDKLMKTLDDKLTDYNMSFPS